MLPTQGRIAAPLTLNIVRELTPGDIQRLLTEQITVSAPPSLQKLTARHHAAARLVATGKTAVEVAILCGYTPQRIRDLNKDPAFKELVSTYEAQFSEIEMGDEVRLREKARNVAEMALDELADRLDDPEIRKKLYVKDLVAISADGLDRTVLPKKTAAPVTTMPTNITFNIAGQGREKTEPKTIEPPTIDQGGAKSGNGNGNGTS